MRSDHIVAAIPLLGHSVKTNYMYSTTLARVNRQSINLLLHDKICAEY